MEKVVILHDKSATFNMLAVLDRAIAKMRLPYSLAYGNVGGMKLLANAIGSSGKAIKRLEANYKARGEFNTYLDKLSKSFNTKTFIIASSGALAMVAGYTSLDLTRGSRYSYRGYTFFVVNSLINMFSTDTGGWIMNQDLMKVARFVNKTPRLMPKFKYTVCKTDSDLDNLLALSRRARYTAADIETSGNPVMISCIAYTMLLDNGDLVTTVLPFINPTKHRKAHWDTEASEIKAWQTMREINANKDNRFIFHNGQYDGSYLVRYCTPTTNYLWDTLHMWHSIYCDLPKSLKFVTSIASDSYRYWKDEISGGEEDDKGTKDKSAIPVTPLGIEKYWRYNALDTYNTFACFVYCLVQMGRLDYSVRNYSTEFALQMTYLGIGYHGFKTHKSRIDKIVGEYLEEANTELRRLRYWLGQPDFNPNSVTHKKDLFYSLLGAKPPRIKGEKKESTDKVALAQIQYQHPLIQRFVEQLHKITKPNKLISDFSDWRLDNGRTLYSLNAAGTNTSRASSAGSPFWIGRNMQNIDPKVREAMVADEGYILFDIDYAQSDNYFVAFESEDEKCIEVVLDPRDTHSLHAAHFFKTSYDEINNDPNKKSKTSKRSATKPIVHGCNYSMGLETMYNSICAQLGREAIVESAKALGYKNAYQLTDAELKKVCGQLKDSYFELYPHLKTWDRRLVKEVCENGGRLSTAFGFTRQFFGKYSEDARIIRQMLSLKGQGGTGGNINRAIYQYYYGRGDGQPSLKKRGLMLLLQVHDSLVGQVKVSELHLLVELMDIMKQPIKIKGRDCIVPVECDLGFSWSKNMVQFDESLPHADMLQKCVDLENKLRVRFGEPILKPIKL